MTKKSEGYYVYKHTFPNGKKYIGITKQTPEKRWQNGTGYIRQKPMWDAILEFGWENIKHEVLYKGLTEEEAKKKERLLIARNKSIYGKNGYNSTTGGYGSKMVYSIYFESPVMQLNSDEEVVAKFDRLEDAAIKFEISPFKIMDSCSARKEYKRSGFIMNNLYVKGFMWEYDYAVCQYTMQGELVAEYPSIDIAYEETQIEGIYRCCKGRGDFTSAGGYVWRYAMHEFNRFPIE